MPWSNLCEHLFTVSSGPTFYSLISVQCIKYTLLNAVLPTEMKNICIYQSRKINTEDSDKTNGNVYFFENLKCFVSLDFIAVEISPRGIFSLHLQLLKQFHCKSCPYINNNNNQLYLSRVTKNSRNRKSSGPCINIYRMKRWIIKY